MLWSRGLRPPRRGSDDHLGLRKEISVNPSKFDMRAF
jgi:hypothetical protein